MLYHRIDADVRLLVCRRQTWRSKLRRQLGDQLSGDTCSAGRCVCMTPRVTYNKMQVSRYYFHSSAKQEIGGKREKDNRKRERLTTKYVKEGRSFIAFENRTAAMRP